MYGVSWKRFFSDIWHRLAGQNIFNGAAALAYYLMLAVFPGVIFLLTLLPFLPIPNLQSGVLQLLGEMLPKETAKLFTGIVSDVTSNRNGGLLSFGLLLTIWSGSSGVNAIINEINTSYQVRDSRPYWKVRLTALLLMILLFILIVGAFCLIVFGGMVENDLAKVLNWGSIWVILVTIFRWIVILAFLLMAFASIYYFAPDIKQEFRLLTPGNFVGAILLLLASFGFKLYVSNFSNFNATYGTLGAAIVLEFWLYIVGIVILLGAVVNVVAYRYRNCPAGADCPDSSGKVASEKG